MSNNSKHRPAPNRTGSKASDIDRMMTPSRGGSGAKGSAAKKFPVVWVVVGALVVLAGIIAVISAGGGDDEPTVGTVAPDGSSSSPGEFQPVTVDGAVLAPFDGAAADPAVGTPAPRISGFDFDGQPVSVDTSAGPVMYVFLAHWCGFCNEEVPVLNEWKNAGLVPDGLQVLAVATGTAPNREFYPPSQWLDDKEWTWPAMADSEQFTAAEAFGVSGFPFVAIVGADGTLLGRSSGALGALGLQQFVADSLARS